MLQIRLSNKATASESGGGAKLPSGETVTVACPDHLVLAELPVAKSLGSTTGVTLVKTVGRRSRRPLGERVHFCVQCDYPIAIYGRLTPCEHAFCLDCARSDSICYLCDERIQKIQTIKMMEGIFICAAPHCLKSFLKKSDFESHVHTVHADLINSNTQKDVKDPETLTLKKPATSESTVQAPTPRPVQDRDDRTQNPHPPPVRPLMHPKHPGPPHPDNNGPSLGPMHVFQPQNFDPSNFGLPGNPNMVMGSSPFGEAVMDHGSLLGYPRPWGIGPNGAPFDPSMMVNQGGGPDQGRVGFFPSPNMMQPGNGKDSRGILAAPPPLPPPPPPLPPPQFAQMRGNFYGGDGSRDGQGYGWKQEKRDGFNGQDQMG